METEKKYTYAAYALIVVILAATLYGWLPDMARKQEAKQKTVVVETKKQPEVVVKDEQPKPSTIESSKGGSKYGPCAPNSLRKDECKK